MIRHINDVLDYNFDEYSRRFPAFFYTDDQGRRTKPVIIPAQAIANDRACPMYFKRLIDVGTLAGDPYYLLFNADPLRGPCDRDTALQFFGDFLYDKLGLQSSYDRASGMQPSPEYPLNGTMDRDEALDAELLPAGNDRGYRTYYDEQMARLRAQEDDEARRREEDEFERKHGFRRDDPDIVDVDVETADDGSMTATPRTGAAGASTRAVGSAQSTAVGAPLKIWYGVDLHIPSTGTRIGYSGRGGSRVGRRPSGGYLREGDKERFDDMLSEALEAKGLNEAQLSPEEEEDIADMFAQFGGVTTAATAAPRDERVAAFMQAHASELRDLLSGRAEQMGDLGSVRDLGSDDAQYGESKKAEAPEDMKPVEEEIDEIVGKKAGEAEELDEFCDASAEQDEDEDVLSESFVRHSTMLARELW